VARHALTQRSKGHADTKTVRVAQLMQQPMLAWVRMPIRLPMFS